MNFVQPIEEWMLERRLKKECSWHFTLGIFNHDNLEGKFDYSLKSEVTFIKEG